MKARQTSHSSRRILWLPSCICLLVLFPAAPAAAHSGAGDPIASDYRTKLTKLTPALHGVKLRVLQSGTRLELRNRTSMTLEVLGYAGEPYLRIGPRGSFANTRSPSVYVNDDLGTRQRPDNVDVRQAAAPVWEKIDDDSTLRWHDHRTHWMSDKPPPSVARDPGTRHRISEWRVTFRVLAGNATESAKPGEIVAIGTLDYIPPPDTGVWWAGVIAAAAAVVGVSLLLSRQWPPRRQRLSKRQSGNEATFRLGLLLGSLLTVAAAAELANSVGYALDSGATGFHIAVDLFTAQTYGTLTAIAALAVFVVAIRHHPATLLALGLAGVCLAVLGGIADTTVFSHGSPAVPWSPHLARLCTATTLALAAGVTISCWLRIRAERLTIRTLTAV